MINGIKDNITDVNNQIGPILNELLLMQNKYNDVCTDNNLDKADPATVQRTMDTLMKDGN